MMTKQELKDLMGWRYPSNSFFEGILLFRVNLFPKSLKLYSDQLSNIYSQSNVWFLLEQLMPEEVNKPINGANPFQKIEHFLSHYIDYDGDVLFGSKDIDWKAVYDFIDGLNSDAKLVRIVNKYRTQLLVDNYDIV